MRTSTFDEQARARLANAIVAAREAAGLRYRRDLAAAADVSKRSIDALETGDRGIGEKVLRAVGAALGEHLTHWTRDTPADILRGAAAPPLDTRAASDTPAIDWACTAPQDEIDRYVRRVAEVSGAAVAARFRADIEAVRAGAPEQTDHSRNAC